MSQFSDDKIETYLGKFSCPICKDPLSVPQSIIKCKHTFCYNCLKNWFVNSIKNSNLRCPLCRAIVDDEPFNNKILQSAIQSFFTLFIEKDETDGKHQSYFKRLSEDKREFEIDLKNKKLFEENFKTTGVGIVDMDDGGVLRCSSCHWEIESGENDEDQTECPHCGVGFRGVDHDEIRRRRREAGENSEDDGESVNTEGERSDVRLDSAEEEGNSDLDGFIIDESDESEDESKSDTSLNSDYYEFNSDGEAEEQSDDAPQRKKAKRKPNIVIDLSEDEKSDDSIEIANKQVKKEHEPKKRKIVIIDDEEEE